MKKLLCKDRFKDHNWSEQLFRRIYCLVITRTWGYDMKDTFMLPVMDMFNHGHTGDCGFYVINKELHLDPTRSKSYFQSNKYLNDVRMLYKKDTEFDEAARSDVLAEGFVAPVEYWSQRHKGTLPGWREQLAQEGAQAWTIEHNASQIKFEASGTYAELDSESGDDSAECEYSEEEEECKSAGNAALAQSDSKRGNFPSTSPKKKVLSDRNPLRSAIMKLEAKKGKSADQNQCNELIKPENKNLPEKLEWTTQVDHEGNSYLVMINHAGRTIKAGE